MLFIALIKRAFFMYPTHLKVFFPCGMMIGHNDSAASRIRFPLDEIISCDCQVKHSSRAAVIQASN